MAKKSISMSKIRQIMKFCTQALGKKRITQPAVEYLKKYSQIHLEATHRLNTPWEELQKLSDYELNQHINPPMTLIANRRIKLFFDFIPEMEKQLRKRGMTARHQYQVFLAMHPDAFKETSFNKYYNQWKKKVNPSMHIEHKEGTKCMLTLPKQPFLSYFITSAKSTNL